MDALIVAVCVLAAALWLLRCAWRAWKKATGRSGSNHDCGSGCGSRNRSR